MKRQGILINNIVWQYGLQGLKYLFPFVLVPYLTRVLGTNGYAVYAYVLSFMGTVQTLADFGFMLSGTKKVITRREDKDELAWLLGSITMARVILAVFLWVVLAVVVRYIPILRENLLYVFVAYIATITRALLPDFVFQGFEDMGPLTLRYFASKLVTVCLTLLLVHSPDALILVALADVAGGVVSLVWSYVNVNSRFGVRLKLTGIQPALAELRDSAVYCVSNIGSSLVSGFTTFIIGLALTESSDIAYWSLALTTVNAVQALYQPITNSLYPHVMTRGSLRPAKLVGIAAAPALVVGTVAYCLLSKQFFLLLGGKEYLSGSWVMIALAPILPLSFYAMLIGWPVLGALGMVKDLTISTVFSGVVNAMLLLLLMLTHSASLSIICFIRCLSELTLLLSRAAMLQKFLRKTTDKDRE